MSATKLGSIASAIGSRLSTISGLKVYTHEPRDLDTLPAATILGPVTFSRTEPDAAESQLGTVDWHLTYIVRLYVPLDDPDQSQTDSRALLGQAIAAIDADRGLGNEVLDASLTSGEYGMTEPDEAHLRQMGVYECQCQVWALI